MSQAHPFVERILLSQEQLQARIKELGAQISADYKNTSELVVIGVLKGAFIFAADLIREITVPLSMEFMAVSSYAGTESTGTVRILMDLKKDIEGKDVLLVEDIMDTGLTAHHLLKLLSLRKPASLQMCCLLRKPDAAKVVVPLKYSGFDIPDAFVVGYGLDWAEKLRELPYIGVLKPEMYQK